MRNCRTPLSQVDKIVDLRLPQLKFSKKKRIILQLFLFFKKKKEKVVPEFGRDPLARGSSLKPLSRRAPSCLAPHCHDHTRGGDLISQEVMGNRLCSTNANPTRKRIGPDFLSHGEAPHYTFRKSFPEANAHLRQFQPHQKKNRFRRKWVFCSSNSQKKNGKLCRSWVVTLWRAAARG